MSKIYVPAEVRISDRDNVLVPQVRMTKGEHDASEFPEWAVKKALKVGAARDAGDGADPFSDDDKGGKSKPASGKVAGKAVDSKELENKAKK